MLSTKKSLLSEAEKSNIPKNNVFGGEYSDDEDKFEDKSDDEFKANIYSHMQITNNQILQDLREFMNNPQYVTNKNDPNTNIVDRHYPNGTGFTARSYNIPSDKVGRMFKFLEICRQKNLLMMFAERQLEYSGLMIDFDIKQLEAVSRFSDGMARAIISAISALFEKYLDFSKVNPHFEVYAAVTRKPEVLQIKNENCYKDGFHILFPGIQLNRETKRFLLERIVEEDILKTALREFKPLPGKSYKDFIDLASAWVPIHFVGSSTKEDKPSYKLFGIYGWPTYPDGTTGVVNKLEIDEGTMYPGTNSKIVICHELSVNWEKKGGIIPKQSFYVKEPFLKEVSKFKKSEVKDIETLLTDGNGGMAHLYKDPNAKMIKSLLDTLNPIRAVDYLKWYRVLCALANTSHLYRPLADYFSQKCKEKYSPETFDQYWRKACSASDNKLSLGSLHFWAREDNPERYKEVRNSSLSEFITKKLYNTMSVGRLANYDVAEILYQCLSFKYAYDSTTRSWYEFILENDDHLPGEIYKWRESYVSPISLKIYMSTVLCSVLEVVHSRIKRTLSENPSDESANYYKKISVNINHTYRDLRTSAFKRAAADEAEQKFHRVGFSRQLDSDPCILGVGNGVLYLGAESQFVTGYHNYMVSRYTNTDYVHFDPRDPLTKKILIVLRQLFPDDKPDSFNFIMHYLASMLDAKPKESLLMLLVGGGSNGKSLLVELFKGIMGSTDTKGFAAKMQLSFLTSRSNNAETVTPAIMALFGARFAYYSETNKSEVINPAKIKEITGQETLAGRGMRENQRNFKPHCGHFVTSNHDFVIPTSDHGTWRRIIRVHMEMKFCNPKADSYDPNNPYERIADESIIKNWPDNMEIKSRFLGYLVHVYENLQRVYGGQVKNVPHPHIRADTEAFRNKQDKINAFISNRIVKTVDINTKTTLLDIISKYKRWYESLYNEDKDYHKTLHSDFENSKLGSIMIKSRSGHYFQGYRALDLNAEPAPGEEYFIDSLGISGKIKDIEVKKETAEQFYERVCNEYDIYNKDRQAALELEKKRQIVLEEEEHRFEQEQKDQAKKFNQKTKEIRKIQESNYDRAGYLTRTEEKDEDEIRNEILSEMNLGIDSDMDSD